MELGEAEDATELVDEGASVGFGGYHVLEPEVCADGGERRQKQATAATTALLLLVVVVCMRCKQKCRRRRWHGR